ncbi:hypothetical protein AB7849_15655 [Rhodanobacter sp. 115]|uniref:hypothetical protein n=1 Tax=Rhodanobacter sp. FW021-MT20 TaxID=1162282 RepID=UPI0034E432DA
MDVTRIERGWAAHYICAARCLFRRNTLLVAGDRGIVVSTVGNFRPEDHGHGPVEKVNADGYYETQAFIAGGDVAGGVGYIEADIRRPVHFESPRRLDLSPDVDRQADLVANTMHENVVAELIEVLRQR